MLAANGGEGDAGGGGGGRGTKRVLRRTKVAERASGRERLINYSQKYNIQLPQINTIKVTRNDISQNNKDLGV